MNANEMINKLPSALRSDVIGGMEKTIQFQIEKPVYLVIANGVARTVDGVADASDLKLRINDEDLVALLKGDLNGIEAFMGGKLQVEGDLMFAQQFLSLFDTRALA
jgi:putative sterol carrier protein